MSDADCLRSRSHRLAVRVVEDQSTVEGCAVVEVEGR